jgi:hypothetical protein
MVLRHRPFARARARVDLGRLRAEHRLQLQDTIRPDRMDVHRSAVRLRLALWRSTSSRDGGYRVQM